MTDALTDSRIRQLPADRDLDALVAVHLMGWRYCHSPNPGWNYECILHEPERADEFKAEYVSAEPFGRPLYRDSMPRYSEDGNAMLAVADALSKRGFGLILEDWRYDPKAPAPWVALVTLSDGHDTGHACADTAPHAVARAALLAWKRRG